jgi:hypothetical protein
MRRTIRASRNRGGRCFCEDGLVCPFMPDLSLGGELDHARVTVPRVTTCREFSYVPSSWAALA